MTQLLVSVRSVVEADAALRGGADIVDIKEPARGSLGRANAEIISAIVMHVAGRVPVSVALGELREWYSFLPRPGTPGRGVGGEGHLSPLAPVLRGEGSGVRGSRPEETGPPVHNGIKPLTPDPSPRSTGARGEVGIPLSPEYRGEGGKIAYPISWFKFGLAGCRHEENWRDHLAHIAQDLPAGSVVAAAYADAERAESPSVWEVMEAMPAWKGSVLLIDTWGKDGRRLWDWLSLQELQRLRQATTSKGIRLAVAGSLCLADMPRLAELAPDILAVRGAVCRRGERTEEVDVDRIAAWAALTRTLTEKTPTTDAGNRSQNLVSLRSVR